MRFSPASPSRAELGESPVWSPEEEAIWWIDIDGRRLLTTQARDGHTRDWATPETPGFVVLSALPGVVVGMETGLFSFAPNHGRFERIMAISEKHVRFNDAVVDPAGRLWAGTMDLENRQPRGRLLSIDADLTVTVVLTGLRTPNGLAVDAERQRLYLSDSHPSEQTIKVTNFDLASGARGAWSVFATTHALAGRPDGAAIDEAGHYWIAGAGGGEIYRFDPAGSLLETISTPVSSPTKVAFGGSDGHNLYLTSKSDGESGGMLHVAPTRTRGPVSRSFGRAEERPPAVCR